jgi:hypothetical protein
MPIPCRSFTDYLARKSEHLDSEIVRGIHPIDTWVGHVSTGRFPAEDGVEHTFDRFDNVFPNLTLGWEDVTAASCVGTPCDPNSQKIGLGFTRDSYKLQRKAYETDLFCFDQILSADRAKQQFSHVIKTLRRATNIIVSHRLKTEALRIAKYHWATANNTLVPITATWDATYTFLTVSTIPTSKLSARHLQRRVQPQIREGAMQSESNHGTQPMLELVTAMDEIWNLVEGNPELSDHWRFQDFGEAAASFYKYGWTGKVGNYGLRDDSYSLRFNIISQNATGGGVLQIVYPYTNVAATEGIKEAVNPDYDLAPIQLDFIWHRMAMTSLVRDTTQINAEMPFASRDFGGKWQFVMDNLTCGTTTVVDSVTGATIQVPIAVNNERRNKGKFIADFSFATKAEHPEFAEAFLVLREQACIVDIPTCAAYPYPNAQNYESANALCATTPTTLTFLPVLNKAGGTYEIAANSILCNSMVIFHDAITGTNTLAALVAQLNTLVSAMGTWAVSASNITLSGTACTSVALPWTELD